jgi:hypothetical protein
METQRLFASPCRRSQLSHVNLACQEVSQGSAANNRLNMFVIGAVDQGSPLTEPDTFSGD